MGLSSDLKHLLRRLQREGYLVEMGKKHVKIRTPDGQLFTCSASPSCIHAANNLERDLRRYRKVK